MTEQKSKKIAYENDTSQKVNGDSPLTFAVSPAKAYLDSLGAGSRRTMRGALARIAGLVLCGDNGTAAGSFASHHDRNGNPLADPLGFWWHRLTRDDVTALRAALDGRYAPATVNKMLSALKGVLREAWRLELLHAEQLHRLIDLKSIPGESLPAGRALDEAEIRALFDVCRADPRPQGARDAAIFALLIGCGLRRAEVAALSRDDYNQESGKLIVRGKRNKQRTAYPPAGGRAALADWLDIRGDAPGPLFYRINKGGAMTPVHLSEQAIYEILWRRAEAGCVDQVSPHDGRRTFISNMLNRHDIAIVQKLAGHSNVNTTARYDRRPEEAKQKAAQTLHIPYRRRRK